jgi:hypothetical protein
MPRRIADDEQRRAATPEPPALRVRVAIGRLHCCASSTMHPGIAVVGAPHLRPIVAPNAAGWVFQHPARSTGPDPVNWVCGGMVSHRRTGAPIGDVRVWVQSGCLGASDPTGAYRVALNA